MPAAGYFKTGIEKSQLFRNVGIGVIVFCNGGIPDGVEILE